MKNHYPLIFLIILPLLLAFGGSVFQCIYWSGAKTTTAQLGDIQVSQAREFHSGDTRRANTTEIHLKFVDDQGVERQITQLSPLTKYFFKYGDTLQIRYFNEREFEGTIWNFPIKFYYIILLGGYLGVTFITILPASSKRRGKRKLFK